MKHQEIDWSDDGGPYYFGMDYHKRTNTGNSAARRDLTERCMQNRRPIANPKLGRYQKVIRNCEPSCMGRAKCRLPVRDL